MTPAASVELHRGVAHELLPAVGGLDLADGAGLGAHDEALGGGAIAPVADALEEVAAADAGGGEEDLFTGDQVVGGEDLVEVVARVECSRPFIVVAGPEPAEDRTAHALDRAR